VTWTNLDGAGHTATGAGFDSGVLRQNGVFTHTFATPGSFDYHCDIHPSMRGTVTVTAPPASPVITPGPPVLSAPGPGATLPGLGTTLQWANAEAISQVHLQVTPANGDGPGIDALLGSPQTSFAVPVPPGWYGLLPDMTYTWRVRGSAAFQAVGADDASWTPWSESTFRTPAVSGAGFIAVAPTQGGLSSGLTPVLQWAPGRPDLFYFELQLSRDATFNTDPTTATAMVYGALVHGGVTTPANSYTVPAAFPLQAGVTYSWRVRPRVQGDGRPAAWSPTFTFTTQTASGSAR
jgi:hypothetical protein